MRTLILAAVAVLALTGCQEDLPEAQPIPATTADVPTTSGLSKEDGFMVLEWTWDDFAVAEQNGMCSLYNQDPNYVVSELGDLDPLTDADVHTFFRGKC